MSAISLSHRRCAKYAAFLSARRATRFVWLLVKQWGRIGTRGRVVDESFATEVLAATAMQKHAEQKRRLGYVES